MSGFTRGIGGEAGRKQRVAGRMFAQRRYVMIWSRWKQEELSGKNHRLMQDMCLQASRPGRNANTQVLHLVMLLPCVK